MSPLMLCLHLCEEPWPILNRCLSMFRRSRLIRFAGTSLFSSLMIVAIANSSAQAQLWISAVSSSPTATGASITWNTAVPSDSQVEYGLTVAYGNVSALAASKVASHAVNLTGLATGKTFHFRVRSGDMSGLVVVSADYTLALSAETSSLTVNPATLTFGTVALRSCSAVQSTNLTASGSSSVTLGSSVLGGTNAGDFAFGGVGTCNDGQVLAPGKTCTVSLKFCPTVAGSRSATNSTPNSTSSPAVVSLSGSGGTPPPEPGQRSVTLSWKANSATNVVSYRLYRSTAAGASYGLIASAIDGLTYNDQGVQSGTTYYYVVTAVDDSGHESGYSNQVVAVVP